MAFETCAGGLMQAVQRSTHPVVMTPHEGEFGRLFRTDGSSVSADKASHTRLAAQQSGAIVVHKGAQTLLAAPDGRVVVCAHAPPWLATAGTGDVLAGFIAAFSAQGMPAMEAACMAVWLHGACAMAIGPGLLSEDLPEQAPKSLQALKPGEIHPF
jgi:NAD(P)H-hydrate epimerase